MNCSTCQIHIENWYERSLRSLGIHEVTIWYSYERDEWVFNHASLGHDSSKKPIGKYPEQTKAWSGKKWTKRLVYGDSNIWPSIVS